MHLILISFFLFNCIFTHIRCLSVLLGCCCKNATSKIVFKCKYNHESKFGSILVDFLNTLHIWYVLKEKEHDKLLKAVKLYQRLCLLVFLNRKFARISYQVDPQETICKYWVKHNPKNLSFSNSPILLLCFLKFVR